MTRPISIIGAPTDVGAGDIGARMGPAALRVAGIVEAALATDGGARDVGDVSGPDHPRAMPEGGYRHLPLVTKWAGAAAEAVGRELAAGRLPMLLGGDHSLAIGSISAVAKHCRGSGRKLRVLWLDAHADFNTSAITPSGNLHGMPVACLCGYGPAELTMLSGAVPAVTPEQVRLIGMRSVDAGEKRFLDEARVQVFDMRCVDEIGMRQTMEQALAGIDRDTHLHVSLDADFLDPDIAPGVTTPARGGPTYRESHLCMEMIADTGLLGSLDIAELNPARDTRNQTAELIVDLVESLFGKSTLIRPHG
ncbi:MAG TPA: arginase [Rhodocyclaceae bacterium]|nr:arginase [Rhodocyclaceae bacterium]